MQKWGGNLPPNSLEDLMAGVAPKTTGGTPAWPHQVSEAIVASMLFPSWHFRPSRHALKAYGTHLLP